MLSCLISYQESYIRNYTFENMEKEDGANVSQLLQNVNNLLSTYEVVADTTFSKSNFLDKLPIGKESFFDAYDIYLDKFRPYIDWTISTRDISRVTIYTSASNHPFADILPVDDNVKHEEWYKKSIEGSKQLSKTWTAMGEDPLSHRRYFRLVSRTYEPRTQMELLICFDIDERLINNLISKQSKEHRYILKLGDGDILLDSFDPSRLGESYQAYDEELLEMMKSITPSSTPISKTVGNKERYMLTAASVEGRKSVEGMTLYSFTPLEELHMRMNQLHWQALWLFIGAFIVSGILIYLFTQGITNRLYILVKRMRSVDIENMNEPVEIKGKDEIAHLGGVFNLMMGRMEKLIKELLETKLSSKEYEIKAKESELYALQTQINPHYLFNTLNAICGNALENGDRETARIVQLLATSFRHVLKKGGHSITLTEEVDIVRTYLDIQVFRFDGRLQYEFDISDEYMKYKLPRLSLQTLVENAIIHGVEKTSKPVSLLIWCEPFDEEHYQLHVTNDGPVMSEERRTEVEGWLKDKDAAESNDARIGLINVHQRLKYMCGTKCGIVLPRSVVDETTITMILPYHPSETS